MAPSLADIVAAHRRAAAQDRRDPEALAADAAAAPRPVPFAAALIESGRAAAPSGGTGIAVIAEVKRRSPSKGELAPHLDPGAVAAEYAAGGAACLSVLTDEAYFGGSPDDVGAARRAVDLPILRKDFTVAPNDVCDARLMGADAVLLIVAALSDDELATLHALATRLALDALVEVHSASELGRALAVGARFVGVNQRDLATFTVDPARAERLASLVPDDVVAVAESGIRGADDARRLAAAGYEAVLVGESVVTSGDRAAAVGALRGHPLGPRAGAPAAAGAQGQGDGPVNEDLLVKICGITTEADALLAVGLGADAVGFILAPSPRQVGATAAGDIVKRLPRDVLTVGVFRDEAPARVVEIANRAGFGAVQLHGHEPAEETRWVAARVACTIKAFGAGDPAIARFADFGADYLLVDGESPGSGSVFDWRLAEGVIDARHMFVSGGLHPGNVAEAVQHLRPRGVDVATGVESSPGRKDPQKLRAFVRNARAAAAAAEARRTTGLTLVEGGAGAGAGAGGPSEGGGAGPDPYDWMDE